MADPSLAQALSTTRRTPKHCPARGQLSGCDREEGHPEFCDDHCEERELRGHRPGFVFNSDGYIITNNHVISEAVKGGEIAVQFPNKEPVPAKLVGRSVSYDIGVIKIDQTGLQAATLGEFRSVVIGDAAIAVGSPLGL